MSQRKIKQIIEELSQPILTKLKYELVDLEYKKERGDWFLRFYIDKPGGITIDDCQKASEQISARLDEVDPIPHRYYLEVSSPGLDRPLKKDVDFERYKGNRVHVKLYKSINGVKNYYGELIGLEEGKVVIQEKGQIYGFPQENVAIVRLSIDF
jgi:ribosome maturation factor RimP